MINTVDFKDLPEGDADVYLKDGALFVDYKNGIIGTSTWSDLMEEGKRYKLYDITYRFYEKDNGKK